MTEPGPNDSCELFTNRLAGSAGSVVGWSNSLTYTIMTTTKIQASVAKARFSELLDRLNKGERFTITLRGEDVANLVPTEEHYRDIVRQAVERSKEARKRMPLNRPGQPPITIKELIEDGRM